MLLWTATVQAQNHQQIQDPHVQQYLEQVFGSGVQVNISHAAPPPIRQERKVTRRNPQIHSESLQLQRENRNEKRTWIYDQTETLSRPSRPRNTAPRSFTVVYPQRKDISPREAESLIRNVLQARPEDTVVIQPYTPRTRKWPTKPAQRLWPLVLGSILTGLILGLIIAWIWWKRRKSQTMTYNEYILPEERPYASELQ